MDLFIILIINIQIYKRKNNKIILIYYFEKYYKSYKNDAFEKIEEDYIKYIEIVDFGLRL